MDTKVPTKVLNKESYSSLLVIQIVHLRLQTVHLTATIIKFGCHRPPLAQIWIRPKGSPWIPTSDSARTTQLDMGWRALSGLSVCIIHACTYILYPDAHSLPMHIYIYIHIHICINICICVHACVYICKYTAVHMNMLIHTRLCMHGGMRTFACMCVQVCMFVYMHACICICIHLYRYITVYMCRCRCKYIRIYVCMYLCTNMCIRM